MINYFLLAEKKGEEPERWKFSRCLVFRKMGGKECWCWEDLSTACVSPADGVAGVAVREGCARTASHPGTTSCPAPRDTKLEMQHLSRERDTEETGNHRPALWWFVLCLNTRRGAVQSEFCLVMFHYVCVNL